MEIAVVSKGSVGKTTIAAGLARLLGRDGYNVIAVDADPSLNLAVAVGIPTRGYQKSTGAFWRRGILKVENDAWWRALHRKSES